MANVLFFTVLICVQIAASLNLPSTMSQETYRFLINNCPNVNLSTLLPPGNSISKRDTSEVYSSSAVPNATVQISNPLPQDEFFEGDIAVINNDDFVFKEGIWVLSNAIIDPNRIWKDGVVPYIISGDYNRKEIAMIESAMNEYHQTTCIKFIRQTIEKDYINIAVPKIEGSLCSSAVGRVGGAQVVNFTRGEGCFKEVGIVIHELMHALGFVHEQSRDDRDEYVDIYWDNIKQKCFYYVNFARSSSAKFHHLGAPYDYGSVMHYGKYDYSIRPPKEPYEIRFDNGPSLPTITGRPANVKIGQRDGLSEIDVWKIRKRYNCDGAVSESITTQLPGTTTTQSSGIITTQSPGSTTTQNSGSITTQQPRGIQFSVPGFNFNLSFGNNAHNSGGEEGQGNGKRNGKGKAGKGKVQGKGKRNGKGKVQGKGKRNGKGKVQGKGKRNGKGKVKGKGKRNGKGKVQGKGKRNGKGKVQGKGKRNGKGKTGKGKGKRNGKGKTGKSKGKRNGKEKGKRTVKGNGKKPAQGKKPAFRRRI